jgi:type I restriction enzyme, S subunit
MEVKAKEPKVRFGEFTGKWEECRFNEIYKKINEKNDLSFGPDKIISVANMYYKPMRDSTKSKIDYMKTYNIMRVGDIAFEGNKSKSYSYGRFVENIIGDGIVSHVFDVFRPITSYDLFFWKYYINNENIMGHILRRVTTKATMMTNLVAKDFLKAKIYVPSIDEQKRIGLFLKQIDSIITLHQQELEQLKESKKTLLSKMFPKEGADRPEIRFAGFTEPWEQRKLKDIAQFNPKTVLPDEFEYVDLESVVGTEMISHRTESKDQAPSRAQRLAQKGDVFYQTVRPYQMNNYLYDLPHDNYVFSTGYAQMRPNIDSYFLLNSVQNKQFVQHVLDRSTGTSYPAINSSDLSNIEIHVPSKLSEQQKIGEFFKKLDDTITLHQQELENLKALKKTLLNLMFV